MRWAALDSESAHRIRHLCSLMHHSSLECALAGFVFFGVPGCRDRRNGSQPKPVQQVGPRPTLNSRKTGRQSRLVPRIKDPSCTAPSLRFRASLSTRRSKEIFDSIFDYGSSDLSLRQSRSPSQGPVVLHDRVSSLRAPRSRVSLLLAPRVCRSVRCTVHSSGSNSVL